MRLEDMRKNELVDELFHKHGFSRTQAEGLSVKLARKAITYCRRNAITRIADDSVYQVLVKNISTKGAKIMCQTQDTKQPANYQKVCMCGQPAKFSIQMIDSNGRYYLPNQYARREKIIELHFCRDCIHAIEDSINGIISSVKQNAQQQPTVQDQAS